MLEMRHCAGTWHATVSISFGVVVPKNWPATVGMIDAIFLRNLHELETAPGSAIANNGCAAWLNGFENEIERRYAATGGGLEIIADVLSEGFGDTAFVRRCFVDNDHSDRGIPPSLPTIERKEQLRWYLQKLAVRMGLHHPDIAASAAVLVIEQTIVWIEASRSGREANTARLLLQCLQHA